jgi:uncharacterized SAM-binding protein YcdF (DUF218 family)
MSNKDSLSTSQITAITEYVDTEAPPPGGQPTAHLIFGTNQARPADIVAERYQRGLAPLIIATGGINRHNSIIEGHEFQRLLIEHGVPGAAIRVEDRSANTWQNVELALPFLKEALTSGLPVTAVCKWYHRRAIHVLKTLVPGIGAFHAITWEPVYAGRLVTRTDWQLIPDGKRRVMREWEEVPRRIADGSFREASISEGAWR